MPKRPPETINTFSISCGSLMLERTAIQTTVNFKIVMPVDGSVLENKSWILSVESNIFFSDRKYIANIDTKIKIFDER